MLKKFTSILILYFSLCLSSVVLLGQDSNAFDPVFDVNKVLAYISVDEDKVNDLKTLKDIDHRYKESWIKEYYSVEISTQIKGVRKLTKSKDDQLTKEQISHIKRADLGSEIMVKVDYLPNNTLKQNEPKELNFSFTIDPAKDAQFSCEKDKLSKYIKSQIEHKIDKNLLDEYQLAAIKFTVDTFGLIQNVHVFESTKDDKIDKLLLQFISDMPKWEPASYQNGKKVEQDFFFTLGDMRSCVVNTLNIKRL